MADTNANGAPGEGAGRQDKHSGRNGPALNNRKSTAAQGARPSKPRRTIRTLAELGTLLDGRVS